MSLDLRRTLDNPAVYNLFQKMSRTREYRQRFMERVPIKANDRVLEVGCGPGTNVEFLPAGKGVAFVGCDADSRYITHAKATYGERAEFYNTPVGDLRPLGLKPFNTALAWGLLHHIDDRQVRTLAGEIDELLEPGSSSARSTLALPSSKVCSRASSPRATAVGTLVIPNIT